MDVRSGRRPSGWARGGSVGRTCARQLDDGGGGVGCGRTASPVGVAAFVGQVGGWAWVVREAVRFRVGAVARSVARFFCGIGRSTGSQWWRTWRGEEPAVAAVAEGARAEGWPADGHEEPRGHEEPGGSVVWAGEAEPAPVVSRHEAWREEARRARARWIWEQFRRGDIVAVVQPNPEVDPEAQPWGIYPSGQPAYVHLDWSTWPGARVGAEAVRAWDDGYGQDAWRRLFGSGRTYALDLPAEPAQPGLPLEGSVDAAPSGPPVAVASLDQPRGPWTAALEPAHGADAPAHPAAAQVADPAGDPAGTNPFAGFLDEPCDCADVDGGHTLGDCRWAHLGTRFDLEDPYV
jgi:hypothetical protein